MYKTKEDLERVIALGKPQNVISLFAESYLQGLEYEKWIKAQEDDHALSYPKDIPNPDFVVDADPLLDEAIPNPDYITFEEYMAETRIVTPYAPAVVDTDGNIVTPEVAEITELIRKYEEVDVSTIVKPLITPKVVTMRQARLALLQSGLLVTIESAIKNGTDEAMKIEWEYATEVRRDWSSLNALATSLNMTSSQLDDLFILAGTL